MLKRVRTTCVATLAVFAAATFLIIAGTSSASAAKPCKSSANANEQATAEAFCEKKLKCSEKTPPQEINCRYSANRWICRCVKAKSSADGRFDVFFQQEPKARTELMSLPVES